MVLGTTSSDNAKFAEDMEGYDSDHFNSDDNSMEGYLERKNQAASSNMAATQQQDGACPRKKPEVDNKKTPKESGPAKVDDSKKQEDDKQKSEAGTTSLDGQVQSTQRKEEQTTKEETASTSNSEEQTASVPKSENGSNKPEKKVEGTRKPEEDSREPEANTQSINQEKVERITEKENVSTSNKEEEEKDIKNDKEEKQSTGDKTVSVSNKEEKDIKNDVSTFNKEEEEEKAIKSDNTIEEKELKEDKSGSVSNKEEKDIKNDNKKEEKESKEDKTEQSKQENGGETATIEQEQTTTKPDITKQEETKEPIASEEIGTGSNIKQEQTETKTETGKENGEEIKDNGVSASKSDQERSREIKEKILKTVEEANLDLFQGQQANPNGENLHPNTPNASVLNLRRTRSHLENFGVPPYRVNTYPLPLVQTDSASLFGPVPPLCAICEYMLDEICVYCRQPQNYPRHCPVALSNCDHFIHYHCTNGMAKCPIERSDWILKNLYNLSNQKNKNENLVNIEEVAAALPKEQSEPAPNGSEPCRGSPLMRCLFEEKKPLKEGEVDLSKPMKRGPFVTVEPGTVRQPQTEAEKKLYEWLGPVGQVAAFDFLFKNPNKAADATPSTSSTRSGVENDAPKISGIVKKMVSTYESTKSNGKVESPKSNGKMESPKSNGKMESPKSNGKVELPKTNGKAEPTNNKEKAGPSNGTDKAESSTTKKVESTQINDSIEPIGSNDTSKTAKNKDKIRMPYTNKDGPECMVCCLSLDDNCLLCVKTGRQTRNPECLRAGSNENIPVHKHCIDYYMAKSKDSNKHPYKIDKLGSKEAVIDRRRSKSPEDDLSKENIKHPSKQNPKNDNCTNGSKQQTTTVPASPKRKSKSPKKQQIDEQKENVSPRRLALEKKELCDICTKKLKDICQKCRRRGIHEANRDCPVAVGECKHAFHLHCVDAWTRFFERCPHEQEAIRMAMMDVQL